MTDSPTSTLLKKDIADHLADGVENHLADGAVGPDDSPSSLEEIPMPSPEDAPIKELSAYCKTVGSQPDGWTKMKAPEKRVAFRRMFCPEAVEDIFDSEDKLHIMSETVENYDRDAAKVMIPRLSDGAGDSYFHLGGIFTRVIDEKWHQTWGFQNFKEWLGAETGCSERKAYHLAKIYRTLVELGIPWEKFGGIGWTKVIELLPVISQENVDEWVSLAKATTADSLKAEVQVAKKSVADPTAGTEPESATVQKKFKLHPDQAETLEAALAQMKVELPTEFDNVAIEHISAAYLSGNVKLSDVQPAEPSVSQEPLNLEECAGALGAIFCQLRDLAKSPYAVSLILDKAFGESFTDEEAHLVVQASEAPFRPEEEAAIKG